MMNSSRQRTILRDLQFSLVPSVDSFSVDANMLKNSHDYSTTGSAPSGSFSMPFAPALAPVMHSVHCEHFKFTHKGQLVVYRNSKTSLL